MADTPITTAPPTTCYLFSDSLKEADRAKTAGHKLHPTCIEPWSGLRTPRRTSKGMVTRWTQPTVVVVRKDRGALRASVVVRARAEKPAVSPNPTACSAPRQVLWFCGQFWPVSSQSSDTVWVPCYRLARDSHCYTFCVLTEDYADTLHTVPPQQTHNQHKYL